MSHQNSFWLSFTSLFSSGCAIMMLKLLSAFAKLREAVLWDEE